jgi:hypothetical protein
VATGWTPAHRRAIDPYVSLSTLFNKPDLAVDVAGDNRRGAGDTEADPQERVHPDRLATGRLDAGDVVARLDHIYDLRRDCLLNQFYYGHRLNLFIRIGFWLEVIIVVGSGASGISGWIIWTTHPELKAIWAVVAATATLLAALKPVLTIDARIKRYSMLFVSYRQLSLSMAAISEEIREAGRLTEDIKRDVARIRSRCSDLAVEDDPAPSEKLVRRLMARVIARVPAESLFYPAGIFRRNGPDAETCQLEGMMTPDPHVDGARFGSLTRKG